MANVYASDNNHATASLSSGQQTYCINSTGFGFTASEVPNGVTITGVLVEVGGHGSSASKIRNYNNSSKLLKAGSPVGSAKNRQAIIGQPATLTFTMVVMDIFEEPLFPLRM